MAQPTRARVLAILGFTRRSFPLRGAALPIHVLALRRLKKHGAITVAQGLAMALAVALPLSLQFVATISEDTAYQAVIDVRSRDPLVTIEKVGAQNPKSYQAAQDATGQSVAFNTKTLLTEVSEYARVSSFRLSSLNGRSYASDSGLPNLVGVLFPQLESKAVLLAGTWPGTDTRPEPIPVALLDSGARLYGLHVGDVFCVASTDDRRHDPTLTCLTLSGIYRQRDLSDPFWLSAPGSSDLAFSADGYWYFEQLVQFTRSVAGRAYRPTPSLLTASRAPALEEGVTRLRGAVQYSEGQSVLTKLDRTIADFLARTAVNQFPIQLVAVEVIAIVFCGLAFITQNFLDAQAQQSALWRIRGWSRYRLGVFLVLQFLALAAPAATAALGIALAVTWIVAVTHRADLLAVGADLTPTLVRALFISLLAVLALAMTLTVRFSARGVASMRSALLKSGPDPWWRWRNLDIVVAALAVPVLVEASLRTQESVRSATLGDDPIGVALPIVGLAMLSLVTLRLLSLPLRLVLLLSHRMPVRLSAWRLSRKSSEHAGVAMVLCLTLGIGGFAAVYDRTETTNALDRADYATGADLRIAFLSGADVGALRQQLATVKGVRALTPILRVNVYPNNSSQSVTAIGIDPASFAQAAWSRPGLSSPPIAQAVEQISTTAGYVEIGRPIAQLSVFVKGLGQPATLAADLRDATGQMCSCSFGSVGYDGWKQLQLTPSFASTPRYPIRLHSLRISPTAAIGSGDLALSSLQARFSDSSDPIVIESFSNDDGWWVHDGTGLIFSPSTGAPTRDGVATLDVPISSAVTVHAPFSATVPALMAAPTMARLGLRPGMTVLLDVSGKKIAAKIAAGVDYVPTLYPGSDDFVVLPLSRMVSAFSAATASSEVPTEVWLALTSDGWSSAQRLGPTSNVDYIVNRRTAELQALNNPVLIQLRAILAMGFVSAVVLAALSFIVHFLIATRRRLAEYAVLQANGLDPKDIRRGIAIEQFVVIIFAFVVGIALMAVEVDVLLLSLQLGPSPADAIPPTILRVDLSQVELSAVVLVGLFAFLGWVTRRVSTAVNVVEELRRLG